MSFNPATNLVYVTPGMASSFAYVQAPEFKPELGEYNWGIIFRDAAGRGTGPVAGRGNGAPPPPPRPPAPPAGNFLVAWDPATETAAWKVPATGGGGTMTTAGNLVFAASNGGDFEAFSADKGEKLWSVKLQGGIRESRLLHARWQGVCVGARGAAGQGAAVYVHAGRKRARATAARGGRACGCASASWRSAVGLACETEGEQPVIGCRCEERPHPHKPRVGHPGTSKAKTRG